MFSKRRFDAHRIGVGEVSKMADNFLCKVDKTFGEVAQVQAKKQKIAIHYKLIDEVITKVKKKKTDEEKANSDHPVFIGGTGCTELATINISIQRAD